MATLKFSWNKLPQSIADQLLNDVKESAPRILEAFSKEIEVNARKNFNQAVNDISGDNPYITVVRRISGLNATISCIGEQVLFAEFGAGQQNAYYEKTIQVKSHFITNAYGTFYVKAHERTIGINAKGFKSGGTVETMPRPSGIVNLGEYGKGYGKDDYWFYYSVNGRLTNREVLWRMSNLNGMYVIKTEGTPPIRALYRARNTAINKLQSGRLKIK